MATKIQNATRSAASDGVVDLFDAGASAGYMEIRSSSQPSDPDDAPTGALLVTIPLNDPGFGASSNGVATMDNTPEPEGTAIATGTAGWFRVYDSNDAARLDGSVSETGGGGNLQLNTTSIVTDVLVKLTAGTVTMPAA